MSSVFDSDFRDAMRAEVMGRVCWTDFVVMLDPIWSVRVYHQKGETLNADKIRQSAKMGDLEYLHVVASDVHGAGVTYSVTSENSSQTLGTFEEAHLEALQLFVDYSDELRAIQSDIVNDAMDTIHQMVEEYVEKNLSNKTQAEYEEILKAVGILHWFALGNDARANYWKEEAR